MSRYLNFEPTLPLPLCQNSYYVTTKVKERILNLADKKIMNQLRINAHDNNRQKQTYFK